MPVSPSRKRSRKKAWAPLPKHPTKPTGCHGHIRGGYRFVVGTISASYDIDPATTGAWFRVATKPARRISLKDVDRLRALAARLVLERGSDGGDVILNLLRRKGFKV